MAAITIGGVLAAGSAQVDGVVQRGAVLSGVLAADVALVDGVVAINTVTLNGNLAAQSAQVDGVAQRGAVLGGNLEADPALVVGAVNAVFSLAGVLTAQPAKVAGVINVTGTGTINTRTKRGAAIGLRTPFHIDPSGAIDITERIIALGLYPLLSQTQFFMMPRQRSITDADMVASEAVTNADMVTSQLLVCKESAVL